MKHFSEMIAPLLLVMATIMYMCIYNMQCSLSCGPWVAQTSPCVSCPAWRGWCSGSGWPLSVPRSWSWLACKLPLEAGSEWNPAQKNTWQNYNSSAMYMYAGQITHIASRGTQHTTLKGKLFLKSLSGIWSRIMHSVFTCIWVLLQDELWDTVSPTTHNYGISNSDQERQGATEHTS